MRQLLRLVIKYHFFLIFVIIEFFSFSLVVRYNEAHKSRYLHSASILSGNIHSAFSSISEYLALKTANKDLAEENARLKNMLRSSYKSNKISFLEIHDTLYFQQYTYTAAKVIHNSINKKNNYLSINMGSKQGIAPEMGVVSPTGIVGITHDVSKNFSTVISLLNEQLKVSAKLNNNNYFGSLSWDGIEYRKAILDEIPYHVKVQIGDTVVTSGYSSIFPEGVLIGFVSDFTREEGENYYRITVTLSCDFKSLSYVHVVANLMKNEQKNLDNTEND